MSRNLAILRCINDKREVRVLWVGDPTLQVSRKSRLWKLGIALLGQHEVVKVVETLNSIVASKDVQAVLNDLTSVAEAASRCSDRTRLILLVGCGALILWLILLVRRILGLHGAPKFLINFVLIEVTAWITCAASE